MAGLICVAYNLLNRLLIHKKLEVLKFYGLRCPSHPLIAGAFLLIHLPLDKIAAISQTMISNAFREGKILHFD